eukprot:GDKI01032109.1.p1 GENE.GDKI01032109.1~~GDKI01032109.1.p1  ORF type:complete len:203 (+),score=31.20 GDKI01032109.1:1-609(+)
MGCNKHRDWQKEECTGVYFVSGNHDYYTIGTNWTNRINRIKSLNVTYLENAIIKVPEGGGGDTFDLAGVPDFAESVKRPSEGGWQAHDMKATVKGRDSTRALVMLAHQPKHSKQASRFGAGLVINGHVHGGQLFPIHILSYLGNPFFAGLYTTKQPLETETASPGDTQDTYVYVSRGTNQWGPSMRLGADREISVVTLRART